MSATVPQVYLFDLVMSLARAVDLMSPAIGAHHARVSYLAYRIGSELTLDENECTAIGLAGLLHDIGAFSLRERLDVLEFELKHAERHSRAGYLLLRRFKPFQHIADMVRYHHYPWKHGAGAVVARQPVPIGSRVLQLADRVEVLIDPEKHVLSQVAGIRERVMSQGTAQFHPDVLAAFERIAPKEYIWLEATSPGLERILGKILRRDNLKLSASEFSDFAALLCRIVDFKSEFTATHSSGVAAAAVALATFAGLSDDELELMRIAAYLHDIGKLAIPSEIIEKEGPLTEVERDIMRSHAYYTYQILESIEGLGLITNWAALHQERLDGTGYPFHYGITNLSIGARIMAVADVFTALTEDRPYRLGLQKEQAIRSLHHFGADGKLDMQVLLLLEEHFDEINLARARAQETATREYLAFVNEVSSGSN